MPTATLLTMRRPRPLEQVEKAKQGLLGVLLALALVWSCPWVSSWS